MQTGIQAKVKTNIQLNVRCTYRYARLYFLTFQKKHTLFYTSQSNLLYLLHPQITSPTFYTIISHLPHCFPISNIPHFYPQSPTSHFLCHPPPLSGVINSSIQGIPERPSDYSDLKKVSQEHYSITFLGGCCLNGGKRQNHHHHHHSHHHHHHPKNV